MKVYVTNENNRLLRSLNDGVDLTKWINDQITRGYISSGVSSLASLTDVNLTGLQPDYVLTYDAVSGKWVPRFNAATAGNPAGTNGQIQFNNSGVFGASANLFWDNNNSRLGVGTNTPVSLLDMSTDLSTNTDASSLSLTNKNLSNVGAPWLAFRGKTYHINNAQFVDSTMYLRHTPNTPGNNGGNGLMFVSKIGNTEVTMMHLGGAYGLEVNVDLIPKNGLSVLSNSTNILVRPGITSPEGLNITGYGTTDGRTTGSSNTLTITVPFSPTSGNAVKNSILVRPTINQTGGANGITRGLFVQPTITAASSWRSIEWSNNDGYGIYGSGTAKNFLAGNLGIGADPSARLHIKGSGDTSATSGFLYEQATGVFRVGITDDGSFKVYSTSYPSMGTTIRGYTPGGGGSTTLISAITGGHHASTGLYASGAYGVWAINTLGYIHPNEYYSGVFAETTTDAGVGLISRGAIIIDRTATTALSTRSSSASLEVQSTTKGFLLPRMNTSQKNAIVSPATGLQVFDTTLNQINVYNGTAWVGVGSSTIPAVATVTATSGNIPAINLQSFPTGIFEIDMAAAGSNVTFNAPTNPVNGGVYTFRFRNVTAHNIDFPASFLDQTGTVYDGNTTVYLGSNDYVTGYFNGTNYVLGRFKAAGTEGQIQFNSSGSLGASPFFTWDNVNGRLGIGTNTPTALVDVMNGSTSLLNITTNNNRITIGNAANLSSGNFVLVNNATYGTAMQFGTNRIAIMSAKTIFPKSVEINHTTSNFGISVADPTARLQVRGSGAVNGVDALLIEDSNGRDLFEVENGGMISLGKDVSGATQPTATIRVNPNETDTNVGIALVPKGTGAITVAVPDGTATGGNARGQYAIDLQLSRGANTLVAAANYSSIIGGLSNQIGTTGQYSSIIGGNWNNVSGEGSAVSGGIGNRVSAKYAAVTGGSYGSAYLYGQRVHASGSSPLGGGAFQRSDITFFNVITGTAQTELFLDGINTKATLSLVSTQVPSTARVWSGIVQCVAIVTAQGTGSVAAGSVTAMNFDVIIKRTSTGGVTLVATPTRTLHVHDTNMSSADFTIDADTDVNAQSLRIRFTPPSGAGADTTIRATATAYLTELGY